MKKASVVLLAILFTFATKSFSQTKSPEAFFVGKWETLVTGTPNGDGTMEINLILKEGKLTGDIINSDKNETGSITRVEVESETIDIYFTMNGYDLSFKLEKVDADNLKGQLINMFEAKAKRIK